MIESKLNSSRNVWENCWEKQNAHFDIIGWGRKIYNFFIFYFLKKFINKQTDFLELGCGIAGLGIRLAPYIKSYTGFDIAANVLKRAEEDLKKSGVNNFVLKRRDVFDLKDAGKYDVVWSQGLVEHFEETEKLIDIHLSLCKEDGTVIISVPSRHSYHYLWHAVTRYKLLRRFWPWADCIFLSKAIFTEKMKLVKNSISSFELLEIKPRILGLLILVIKK